MIALVVALTLLGSDNCRYRCAERATNCSSASDDRRRDLCIQAVQACMSRCGPETPGARRPPQHFPRLAKYRR